MAGGHALTGAERSMLLPRQAAGLIAVTTLLILEAMNPGPLWERAGQFAVDRRRGRSDCVGIHQASEIPAARAATNIPAFAAIP